MPYSACSRAGSLSLHSVGRSRVRSGHRRCHLVWVAVIVAVLAAPATAAVASPPAVDQYTQHLPTAGGGSGRGRRDASGRAARSAPQQDPGGPVRSRRAAPRPDSHGPGPGCAGAQRPDIEPEGRLRAIRGRRRGFVTVVADTAGTGASLALIGALAGIALAGAWNRFFGRRRSPDQLL